MNTCTKWLMLAALLAAPACTDSDDVEQLQALLNTMDDCFPGLNAKIVDLLDIADTWRMNSTMPVPDPVDLTWIEQADGSVDVSYMVDTCTFTARIVFYSPTGVAQDLDLAAGTSLNVAIDDAATELALLFGNGANPPPFMVTDWVLVGTGAATVTGSGALTAVLLGNTDMLLNRLGPISTTTATPNGGVPPGDSGLLVSTSGATSCSMTFATLDLETDAVLDQAFPIGTMDFTLVGPQSTVTGTTTFDGTVTATIVVAGIPGEFTVNLDSGNLVYNP